MKLVDAIAALGGIIKEYLESYPKLEVNGKEHYKELLTVRYLLRDLANLNTVAIEFIDNMKAIKDLEAEG